MIDYIRTSTGRAFTVEPKSENVNIDDIATALSRAPRWGGHTLRPYPVSAHAVYVSYLVPLELAFEALHHDDSEAYLADIPSPFKALLPDYKKLEAKIMDCVSRAFGFSWPVHPLVKKADEMALYHERVHLFSVPFQNDVPIVRFTDCPGLAPEPSWNWDAQSRMSPERHADQFLLRSHELSLKRK